jgi:hypothetical protein
MLASCAAPAANGPVQVSSTPQANLGTPIPTLAPSLAPTPTANSKVPMDLLMTLNDVPAGFRLTVDDETTVESLAQGANVDPAVMLQTLGSRGWITGWHRSFQKDGFGLQLITDAISAYRSSDGAKQGLAENVRSTTSATPAGVQISLGGAQLGDEALAYQIDTTSGANQFTTLAIYFRFGGFSNTIALSGTRGLVDLSQAIDLAKKQLDRER